MRIVITEAPGVKPLVFENMDALIFAAFDSAMDGSTPVFAHGSRKQLAHLAAVILSSIKTKFGDDVFYAVVRGARQPVRYPEVVEDITESTRATQHEDRP